MKTGCRVFLCAHVEPVVFVIRLVACGPIARTFGASSGHCVSGVLSNVSDKLIAGVGLLDCGLGFYLNKLMESSVDEI